MAIAETHSDPEPVPAVERRQRADAVRNRAKLLEAASELFRERGLDVGVSEIAERAGIGRATLFRNFPTKSDLVIAIIVERFRDAIATGRELLERGEPRGRLLSQLVAPIVEGQQLDRALFEGVAAEAFLADPEIQAVHQEMIEVLDALIAADHAAGTVRGDIGAFDVLMLIKGACKAAAELNGEEGARVLGRQMALVHAAISAQAEAAWPLPEAPMTLEEFQRQCRAS